MKKILILLCAGLMVCFVASGALAYTATDTPVYKWKGAVNTGVLHHGASDPISSTNPGPFNTYGYDFIGGVLTIYTNWSPVFNKSIDAVATADLFIDFWYNGPGFDYAIGLDDGTNGTANRITNVYDVATNGYNNTQFYFAGQTSLQYGGSLDAAGAVDVPAIALGNVIGNVPVVWTTGIGNDPDNSVAITLGAVDNFTFFWASGTCGNGPIDGKVPLPGAMLLLGAGMARLVAYARRRRGE
ncbi:VPLPA-CTERM sorting domain-containing protein [Desulfobacca acetoxidans]|uniref:PEP motif anchor domain protein n=1 Tax=Desulfobacca acetoxidans (strain ATCC 700848 / DSM 11109 / ASRB2) TaxID=880072 RepID=F2NDF2_DESAR|nr:VPLPA-CTERM sorting domain-containing protein [Desulfobacca acetoxidans]AEB10018.1 protein of unknown function DUF1555 [Desulfobacca acetoxidans DSM 11109]